jgi:hypothetical protein
MMTGLWFPSAQEKQAGAADHGAERSKTPQGMAPPAAAAPRSQQQAQQMLALPSWEDIVAFLRNDAMRHFRIDIQTDSTIALQDAEDQGDYAEDDEARHELFAAI